LLSLASRKLTLSLQQRIAGLGITPGQFSVLLELSNDDGLTQRDLCVRLSVEQGTMAHTIRRMLRDELVHLTKHESDARSSRLHLTAKAHGILPPATEAAAEANAEAFTALTPDEVRRLKDYLRRLID
jgi:DNA-binding MarR family transcriptional regulator